MQRTLFVIPHEIAGIPLFGVGWLLGIVALITIGIVIAASRWPSMRANLGRHLVSLAIAAAVLVFVAPQLELRANDGTPLGIAIRGYGIMLLLAVSSAVALALYRAPRLGLNPEHIFGLAPWLVVAGLVGARLFYVIQYHDRYSAEGGLQWSEILRFFQGGLVVYGSIIGGFLAVVGYCLWQKISVLRMTDCLIPCLFVGIFFGRLGCLLNGCCYGGACNEGPTALHFPPGSPVYLEQIANGRLIGLQLQQNETGDLPTVSRVAEGSLADQAGITVGEIVRHLGTYEPQQGSPAWNRLPRDEHSAVGLRADIGGKLYVWSPSQLPARSAPVAPAQIFSSLSALLVAALLLVIDPRIKIPGMLTVVGFSLYAIVRFVLELVRSDEPGRFGTVLTISQWVSVVVLICCAAASMLLIRRPRSPENYVTGPAKAKGA